MISLDDALSDIANRCIESFIKIVKRRLKLFCEDAQPFLEVIQRERARRHFAYIAKRRRGLGRKTPYRYRKA